MARLLRSSHLTPKIFHRTFSSILSKPQSTALLRLPAFPSPPHSVFHPPTSLIPSLNSPIVPSLGIRTLKLPFSSLAETQNEQNAENQEIKPNPAQIGRKSEKKKDQVAENQPDPAQIGRKSEKKKDQVAEDKPAPAQIGGKSKNEEDYPSGEFQYQKMDAWKSFIVKMKMLVAYPWHRIQKDSVHNMTIRGKISDQLKSCYSKELSLPQICENFTKAAYDPRISGIYLHIELLDCGWGKIDEIRRHIFEFKKSGKFVIAYLPAFGEKEYYLACACEELYVPPSAHFSLNGLTYQAQFLRGVYEKIGIEPEVEKVGKYKSVGDQLMRKTMSKEHREMLNAILDNIYGNWMDVVCSTKGKKREDIEKFINEGVYKVEQLKEEGLITDIRYEDEVFSLLRKRLSVPEGKPFQFVNYRKYSRVRKSTLGLTGGSDQIAVIRTSGSIIRGRGRFSSPSSCIIAEQVIEKIRSVRRSNKYKAAIIRIDSGGGDALASDLMWREIRLLAKSIPVVASMSDVAASGGYYMAMAADTIVAENLTLTGSIGVIKMRFSFGKLFKKIGFNKEVISRGRFSELYAANHRTHRPDEAELFAKSAQNVYKRFRDKAASSRSMNIDEMEKVAQGRVWTGKDALSHGLIDAIGGMSRAVAIAKQKAKIPQDKQVTLVELSRPSLTLGEFLPRTLVGASVFEAATEAAVNEFLQEIDFSDGVQARMENLNEASPISSLLKGILGSI